MASSGFHSVFRCHNNLFLDFFRMFLCVSTMLSCLHNSWILHNKFVNKTNIWIVHKTRFYRFVEEDWMTDKTRVYQQWIKYIKIWIFSSFVMQERIARILQNKMDMVILFMINHCQNLIKTTFCWIKLLDISYISKPTSGTRFS